MTSLVAGTFAVLTMLSAFFFGNIVDHNKKRFAMIFSTLISLTAYVVGACVYFSNPETTFHDPTNWLLWLLILILMIGSVAGNLRMIALTTLISKLFEEGRDKANGMVSTVNGVSFTLTSVLSGLAIGFLGMDVALVCALCGMTLVLMHLLCVRFAEEKPVHEVGTPKHFDVRGTIDMIRSSDGLFMLIFFTTFNNFLGGVFMALMDAYGLSLMSVEAWGILLAVVSVGFMVGGTIVARFGLGSYPLRRLLTVNIFTWATCIFFAIQPSIILLAIGMLIWMTLTPFVESTEHTIIQAVVPYERQGRVIGFAQSVESTASPITAFLIGPIAQFFFIPFMTTGAGVALIGDWFGVGMNRGIALVFILAGFLGLCMTLIAFRTRAYKVLSEQYAASLEKVAS
jgi:DHA3 family multidrug efflux protein-like MFS transporter